LSQSWKKIQEWSRQSGSPSSMAPPSPPSSSIIMDRHYKIRYFASFSESTCWNVELTLRMVATGGWCQRICSCSCW
jgi:hypothetical protein